MESKGIIISIFCVLIFSFFFDAIAFWIVTDMAKRVNGMSVSVTKLERDRSLLRRIEAGENFSRTLCIDGKLTACGKLRPIKK